MAELTLQDGHAGLDDITFTAAAAGGDQIPVGVRAGAWDLGVVLIVKNGALAAQTATVAGHDPITVPASGGIGIVPVFRQKFGSLKSITYSAVDTLTVAAVRLTSADPDLVG